MEVLQAELAAVRQQLEGEQRRSASLAEELRQARQQTLVVQSQAEQEEELITNTLFKRLEQLKREQASLREVEQREAGLVGSLQRRLDEVLAQKGGLEAQLQALCAEKAELRARLARAGSEKVALEAQLEAEQEYVMNTLQKKLEALALEKRKLRAEKADLERQLAAEQHGAVERLRTAVARLAEEKGQLQQEKGQLQKQVSDLGAAVERLNRDRCRLEAAMEAEEEAAVNRLQRQLDAVTGNYRLAEARLEALGVPLRELGLAPVDASADLVYGRSPGRGGDGQRLSGYRRERSLSSSSSLASGRDMAMAMAGLRRDSVTSAPTAHAQLPQSSAAAAAHKHAASTHAAV